MYENQIFPGVETIYDYLSYCKANNDNCIYSSKGMVKVLDDAENRIKECHFFCGCTGYELIEPKGTFKVTGYRMPFIKIKVKQDLHSPYTFIDDESYEFCSYQDEVDFLEFAKVYNGFIDKMIKVGMEECFSLSERLYTSGLELPTKNFINMIPQQFFVEFNVYKAMLRNISWKDRMFANYVDFNMDEIKDAYNLIHHKSNEQTFQNIQNLFNNFANVISERISIPSALLKLTSFLLIRKGAIELFSAQWKNNYDSARNYNNAENYIAECVQKNILSSSDFTAMTMLTYYLMSVDSTIQDDFYVVIQKVYSVVSKYENQKRQESFRTQLFQSAHNTNVKTEFNINDVDLMSGDEFENFVCKLFKKMGFQAYVTKHSGDQGIDVIAEKEALKIGVQAKCYASTVGNSAIQEAVAGRAYYGCNRVMVVTNSTFTKSAEELASANNVVLWGRDILKEKLIEYPISL